MTTRLGVDIGGTFTDLVYFDEATGQVHAAKGATTTGSPDEGVATLVRQAVPQNVLSAAQFFFHGSTVGLNALLERKGASVGLITTRGFRDILEMRRGEREDMFNMLSRPAPPLIPRWLRLAVAERLYADGRVHTSLDEADVRNAAKAFIEERVDCIAVVFLHAYANPHHELEAERILREAGFEGEISLSHRVSGEFREYERTSTTSIDAYVRPAVAQYLRRLQTSLVEGGFRGNLLVTSSGGGAMSFAEAERRPFETIMSGPVAGAVGAAALCRDLGIDRAITADVGGTSFDTCLIVDGQPHVKYEGEVAGMPLQCTWVDVRSIGAGGGSIAYVDTGGLLRAGPQSAGATPGPASYGRGGTLPTATDAAGILGMLGYGALAGGVDLDFDAARVAFAPLVKNLGLGTDELAQGVLTILAASMANAIRSVTVEQGEDPRAARLIAFGGAGPLFATLLARELEIREIIVPNYAGNFSAWGLLCQDVVRSTALTSVSRLDDDRLQEARRVLDSLFVQLAEEKRSTVVGEEVFESALDLRYTGQEYTLTIPVGLDAGSVIDGVPEIRARFRASYERTFGHSMEEEIEIVSVRASARTSLPRLQPTLADDDASRGSDEEHTIKAYSFARGSRASFRIINRSDISPDAGSIVGPLIILEPTATTYVDVGFEASTDRSGTLFLVDAERQ